MNWEEIIKEMECLDTFERSCYGEGYRDGVRDCIELIKENLDERLKKLEVE
jgi:hypothetical protein